jgi:predicted neutral ceramidase superfamily lipid hydrolase
MDIQATISKLQSDIKQMSGLINENENEVNWWLCDAKENPNELNSWRNYHYWKDSLNDHVKEQKINKSLYKLMCKIQKQMPDGNISMNEIREM